MTRTQALQATQALNDIEDFELFMDQVEAAYQSVEGNLSDFFNNSLVPIMKAELARLEAILEAL
jgi:hypothetical protein